MTIKHGLAAASFLAVACLPARAGQTKSVDMGSCDGVGYSTLFDMFAKNTSQGNPTGDVVEMTPNSFTIIRFDDPSTKNEKIWLLEEIAEQRDRRASNEDAHKYPDTTTGREPLTHEEMKPIDRKYNRPATHMDGVYVTYTCQ